MHGSKTKKLASVSGSFLELNYLNTIVTIINRNIECIPAASVHKYRNEDDTSKQKKLHCSVY